ncbi:hypothetical protein [Dokdonia sp.]|uniref:hypothetical protein n=1 Tax=Dokdonia sp. TaxID=2024995 RepID=UPI003264B4A0
MKHINKASLRKITIADQKYLWKVGHYHLESFKHAKCVEKVVIYLKDYKKAPLQLLFREEDNLCTSTDIKKQKWCVGYPETGVIWLSKPRDDEKPQTENIDINLNRPAIIRKLIEYYISNGWCPKEQNKPFLIENALLILEEKKFLIEIASL